MISITSEVDEWGGSGRKVATALDKSLLLF